MPLYYVCLFFCFPECRDHYITSQSLSFYSFFFFKAIQLPLSQAGTGHNVATHHNSPLEHFQKLLTKKVRRLWQVRMCAGAVQSRYMCNLTKGEEGRQTKHIIRMNELGNCDDMILFMMVVMQW